MPSRSKVEALRSFASKVRCASHYFYKHASQTPYFSVFTFHLSLISCAYHKKLFVVVRLIFKYRECSVELLGKDSTHYLV